MTTNILRLLTTALIVVSVGGLRADDRPATAPHEAQVKGEETPTEPHAAPHLFQHVIILGASVSAGFTIAEPFGGKKTASYRFANFIDAAIAGSHGPVTTHARPLLFLKAKETLEKLLASAVEAKPSLVIALDALFWFCYGEGLTEPQRIARFEEGMRLLVPIDAPLLLGDIPDASAAVGKILGKNEMPTLETIAECNARLERWAASRKNVRLFPVSELLAHAGKNLELTLPGITIPAGETARLLQQDSLHPSRHGLAILAIAALNGALAISEPTTGSVTGILADPTIVYEGALKKTSSPAAAE
ncbi:MAG TPA: hypothetical protein VFV83_09800 [Chthoniobacteraceae bacterium]|nr:hypothetical protein [Chthoniobacteraceae bacterium]